MDPDEKGGARKEHAIDTYGVRAAVYERRVGTVDIVLIDGSILVVVNSTTVSGIGINKAGVSYEHGMRTFC